MSLDIFEVDETIEQQEEKDVLGGFQPFESGLIPMKVKAAFMDKFGSGALNITVLLEDKDGRKFTYVECTHNKKGENFYVDKKTGSKKEMLGLFRMKNLAEMLTGSRLNKDTVVEDRFHNIWDRAQSKEVSQKRKTFTEWSGKLVYVGMLQIISNKQVKSGDEYVPTNEEQVSNEIDRFFNKEKKTLTEIKAGSEAEFFQKWVDANEGKTRNKFKEVKGAPSAGIPTQPAADDLNFDE